MSSEAHKLVRNVEEILENVETLDRWRHGSPAERKFFANLVKNGKVFVAEVDGDRIRFAPSKFAGYRRNDMRHKEYRRERDGRVTNPCIDAILDSYAGPSDPKHPIIEAAFLRYCGENGVVPSTYTKTLRRYWIIGNTKKLPDAAFRFPDELEADSLDEGEKVHVTVSRYERSAKARKLCIERYGPVCTVCDLRFEDRYGDMGKGCIHVHHLVPLNSRKKNYKVNPKTDLRPVCPNCHWMLHVQGETMKIEKLRAIVKKHAKEE